MINDRSCKHHPTNSKSSPQTWFFCNFCHGDDTRVSKTGILGGSTCPQVAFLLCWGEMFLATLKLRDNELLFLRCNITIAVKVAFGVDIHTLFYILIVSRTFHGYMIFLTHESEDVQSA